MRLLCFALAALLFATPARAEWWVAETDKFKVYSSGSRDDAVQMAIKLERLDQALRFVRGTATDNRRYPDTAKVTIFQFGTTDDIGRLAGSEGVAGFFIPRAGESVAFVPLTVDQSVDRSGSPGARQSFEFANAKLQPHEVLFHEYTHYFMFQHASAAYPSWYIEGFAELFGTLELTETGFNLGAVPESRKIAIRLVAVEQDDLFNPPRDRRSAVVDYAHGWLVTSYLSFEPSRQGQLTKFLSLLNQGKTSKVAAREAFGDLEKLENEINAYRRQRVRGISARFPTQAQPNVSVRALSAAENAQMKLRMTSKAGVTREKARRLVADARKLVATYPDSLPVLMAATEAEFDADNLAEADALAQRVLAIDPKSIDAFLYRARIAIKWAKKNPDYLRHARAHYLSVNALAAEHPAALAGYYLTYVLAKEKPPEAALIALEAAYSAAPFDPEIRKILAHLLFTEQRDKDALSVLGPIINSPHADRNSRKLRDLISRLEMGGRQPLIDELAPKLDDKKDESE